MAKIDKEHPLIKQFLEEFLISEGYRSEARLLVNNLDGKQSTDEGLQAVKDPNIFRIICSFEGEGHRLAAFREVIRVNQKGLDNLQKPETQEKLAGITDPHYRLHGLMDEAHKNKMQFALMRTQGKENPLKPKPKERLQPGYLEDLKNGIRGDLVPGK